MKIVRVAVVGGGLAGLTTAHFLKQYPQTFLGDTKIRVSVFEAAPELPNEVLPLSIADTEHEALSLLRALNLELVPQLRSGRMPCSELMMAIIAEILRLKSNNIIQNPTDWSTKKHEVLDCLDSFSIIEFFVQKGKDAATIRSQLQTTFLGLYTDNLDELSALDALRFLSQYLHSKFLYSVKEGESLVEALVKALNIDEPCVFLNKPIQSIDQRKGCWEINFVDSGSQNFALVVMAEPQSKPKYFKPGERHLVADARSSNDALFSIEAFLPIDAPASINGMVKSAHRIVNQGLLPAISEEVRL